MPKVITGLEKIKNNLNFQRVIGGKIAYLCHSASIDSNYNFGVSIMKDVFKDRLVSLLGPQHGIVSDVQDNMVESTDFTHPYFNLLVHSLYSKTRAPTEEMLQGIDTIVVDLQDVGTRIYTYITTLKYVMEKASKLNIKVVVLDRPNPLSGLTIEGNVLERTYLSFVGASEIPMRHSLTIGEMALYFKRYENIECDLKVVKMDNWTRNMLFDETSLPFVPPSPNLPTFESTMPFPGTVLFEGTNISEGRGTTRSLELVGHPDIEPFSFVDKLNTVLKDTDLKGFKLRPLYFMPTFQKHKNIQCGGLHIHVTDRESFRPWRLAQMILKELYHHLDLPEFFKSPPYEYEYDEKPIDLINGTSSIRDWVKQNGSYEELLKIEHKGIDNFLDRRESILLYH